MSLLDELNLDGLSEDDQIRVVRKHLRETPSAIIDFDDEVLADWLTEHKDRIIEMGLSGELDKE